MYFESLGIRIVAQICLVREIINKQMSNTIYFNHLL